MTPSRWYDLADPDLASYMKKYRKEIDEIERGSERQRRLLMLVESLDQDT